MNFHIVIRSCCSLARRRLKPAAMAHRPLAAIVPLPQASVVLFARTPQVEACGYGASSPCRNRPLAAGFSLRMEGHETQYLVSLRSPPCNIDHIAQHRRRRW